MKNKFFLAASLISIIFALDSFSATFKINDFLWSNQAFVESVRSRPSLCNISLHRDKKASAKEKVQLAEMKVHAEALVELAREKVKEGKLRDLLPEIEKWVPKLQEAMQKVSPSQWSSDLIRNRELIFLIKNYSGFTPTHEELVFLSQVIAQEENHLEDLLKNQHSEGLAALMDELKWNLSIFQQMSTLANLLLGSSEFSPISKKLVQQFLNLMERVATFLSST